MPRGLPHGPGKPPKRIGAKWASSAPPTVVLNTSPEQSKIRGEGQTGIGPVDVSRRAPRYQLSLGVSMTSKIGMPYNLLSVKGYLQPVAHDTEHHWVLRWFCSATLG